MGSVVPRRYEVPDSMPPALAMVLAILVFVPILGAVWWLCHSWRADRAERRAREADPRYRTRMRARARQAELRERREKLQRKRR